MEKTRDSIAEVWGQRTPYVGEWPVRVDQNGSEEPDRWVQSACVLCSNDCGMDIGVKDGRIVAVRGREVDRVNRGRLGPKGLHGWVANHSQDRLLHPLVRKRGELRQATWEEAMDLIVQCTKEYRDKYTPSSIAFYTTGQLFIEEYYTLAVIGKAGLGTPHMDGNTRLCTATAEHAMMASFGSDGQVASYEDVDHTDCLLIVGHNPAATGTVLWMRMLDRRRGPRPPKLVVIDPRKTDTAAEADVHLAPRIGTNVPVLNGLIHLLIENGHVDRDYIDRHTVGFDRLKKVADNWPPEHVEQVTGVPAEKLRQAARLIGEAPTLLSTCLQGVYQSMQATAAACQVNNINLIRGMIGKPGAGVLQMNGQPTSQNTRETGCNGALPAFYNWDNEDHVREIAAKWNVDPAIIPHWAPPTHAMQIFRFAELGTVRMLWISCTNPAVSLPQLTRIRKILSQRNLFLVVQDIFMTETARYADVVLPAAMWGEKTGTFTNTDRTVHISHKAIEPPGEARPDLDIWLDYARRMDFRDKDGQPLIKWNDAEGAFNAWREFTRGRLCDYSGISYARLSEGSGIPWPCNDQHPNGQVRLYENAHFMTQADVCQQYGHDLDTGAEVPATDYRADDPDGRAILRSADYLPPHEQSSDEYPFMLSTGRIVYHWHTRTKTARSRELQDAAPDAFVQISRQDADRLGIADGDWVEVESVRGKAYAKARIGEIMPGDLFMPFHYGYWDRPGHLRAANELTITEWDPVSKQPHFKYAAVRLRKVTKEQALQRAPGQEMSLPEDDEKLSHKIKKVAEHAKQKLTARDTRSAVGPQGGQKIQLGNYLGLLRESEEYLAQALLEVSQSHAEEPDIHNETKMMAKWCQEHLEAIEPFEQRYNTGRAARRGRSLFRGPRLGSLGLLRDLHDLWLMTQDVDLTWEILYQASQALRDKEFERVCNECSQRTERQMEWFRTRIDQAAPQVLVVPP